MPTKKPRFLVTIDPENHQALKHLAVMRGMSVSAVINEMLKPALGPLMALVRASTDPAQTDLVDYLESVKAKVGATLEEVSASALERGSRAADALALAGAGEGREVRASTPRSARTSLPSQALLRASLTPSSNTGVTSERSKGNQRVSKPGRKGSPR